MRRSRIVNLLVLTLCSGASVAQGGPLVVKLVLTPAAPAVPALKYHLLPWAGELRPGNGVVFYQRAANWQWGGVLRQTGFEQLDEWLYEPMTKELASKLAPFARSPALHELDIASRCEYVDWQMTSRLREETFLLALPDVSNMRTLAKLLSARIRLEIHEGKLEKAVYSVQSGLALGRDLGQNLTLISSLTGLAVSSMMLVRVEELIQQPLMPNLYWALTDLPEPLADLRRGLQSERISLDGLFPEVRQALESPKLYSVALTQMRQTLEKLRSLGVDAPPAGYAALVAIIYPQARAYFLHQGRTEAELADLPVTQVVLMYELTEYDRWMDDTSKYYGLPYWQARPRLARQEHEFREKRRSVGGGLLAAQIVPGLQNVYKAQARTQRRVALLRTVEALRLHAAAHEGRLPETLEDVREVPLPLDPMTGKAFNYHRQADDRATLEAPPPPGEEPQENNAVRYELTLVPRKQ